MIRQMMAMQGGMGGGSPFGGMGGAGAQNPLVAGFGAQAGGNNTPSTGGDNAATAGTPGQAAANPFGMNPDMMRMLMGMGGGGGGGAGGAGGLGALGGLGGLGGMGGFGGFGGGAQQQTPAAEPLPQDTRSLEERFSNQLRTLNEMGLVDPQQNLRALSMTGGNVEAAIELIFSGRECSSWCHTIPKSAQRLTFRSLRCVGVPASS
jgi:ubiquilin